MSVRDVTAVLILLITVTINGASLLGPNVSTYDGEELKWEQYNMDYFVLFKSLLSNKDSINDSSGNPQADNCKSSSSYKLSSKYFPTDAYIERAFIIWTSAVDPSKFADQVDNNITLKFKNTLYSSMEFSEKIEGDPHYLGDPDSFKYESVKKIISQDNIAYFTYRMDITYFFKKIYEQGSNLGFENLSDFIAGTYTVSNLECTEDKTYMLSSTMVSGWAILLVYSSADEKMRPKNIYIYNGTDLFWHNEAEINVTDFIFPENPYAKLTLMVFEGDPDNVIPGTYMENLFFRGDPNLEWQTLSNRCNPDKGSYTEIYNSISSRYYWDDDDNTKPFCLGGIGGNSAEVNTETIQYAMDVDTFLVSNENCKGHLKEGDTDLDLKVSANQDVILTNLLVLSVDTRAADFDIPEERELNICSCSEDPFKVCMERAFYYTIKIQNWGEKTAKNILVKKELLSQEKYISGSTEIKYRTNGKITEWKKIEETDKEFPLEEGYLLPFEMKPCTESAKTTCDTAVIRFKVDRPDGVSAWDKGEFITAAASIEEDSAIYRTNTNVPLKITMDPNCPELSICRNPDMEICGRLDEPECESSEECPEKKACKDGFCISVECTEDTHCSSGEVCLDNICVYKPNCEGDECLERDLVLHIKKGKNSPSNNGNPIYLNENRDNLLLAQIAIAPEAKTEMNPAFYFYSVFLDFKTGTEDLREHISDFRLIYDKNGNGLADENEEIISTAPYLIGGSVEFAINKTFPTNEMIYFLVLANFRTSAETGPDPFVFTPFIAGRTGIRIDDEVSNSVDIENELIFESFTVIPESSKLLFVTKTDNQPPVPENLSGEYEILSFSIISKNEETTLKDIDLSLVTSENHGIYGENITKISLYLDTNKNNIVDENDKQLQIIESFEKTDTVTFNKISEILLQNESKNFIITVKTKVPDNYSLIFYIPTGGVRTSSSSTPFGLPIYSKQISSECEYSNPSCNEKCFGTPCDKAEGCGCNLIF